MAREAEDVSSSDLESAPPSQKSRSKSTKASKSVKAVSKPGGRAVQEARRGQAVQSKGKRQVSFAPDVAVVSRIRPVKAARPRPLSEICISTDDPHWPWPLTQAELQGPEWQVRARYSRVLEMYHRCNIVYPNHIGAWRSGVGRQSVDVVSVPPVQNCAAALGGGSVHALQDEAAAPSDGVTAALQESDTRLVVNRRAKITESGIAVKWASMRHTINQHFQALVIMRYDGNNLRTEACDRKRNMYLLLDAARHCMNETQLLEFKDDVAAECRHMGQPDGLRCVSMLYTYITLISLRAH